MTIKRGPKIGIIGGLLAPHFNEAGANAISLLSRELNASVLTYNDLGFAPFWKKNQYFVVNGVRRQQKMGHTVTLVRERTPYWLQDVGASPQVSTMLCLQYISYCLTNRLMGRISRFPAKPFHF